MKLSICLLTCLYSLTAMNSYIMAAGPDLKDLDRVRGNAVSFLKKSQLDDGAWTAPNAVGITSLVVYGMLQSGVDTKDESVAAGLKYVADHANEDGTIAGKESRHLAYETAVSVMMLSAANGDGTYQAILDRAEKYLRRVQFDESKGIEQSDIRYGGMGYTDDGSRPDLSNTVFCLEALKATGAGADDPAIQKALVFISRCQNLESQYNTSPFAAKVNDGGFFYTAAAGGSSAAGNTNEGGLRSYGSMTYAGLRSMIYAGLTAEDPRVKAATKWIQENYTLTDNPGMGPNGLFYYYQLFSKALDTMQAETIVDSKQVTHDWRKELAEELFKLQAENGSWVNTESTRWFEGDPNLVTAYSLIALKACEPPAKSK